MASREYECIFLTLASTCGSQCSAMNFIVHGPPDTNVHPLFMGQLTSANGQNSAQIHGSAGVGLITGYQAEFLPAGNFGRVVGNILDHKKTRRNSADESLKVPTSGMWSAIFPNTDPTDADCSCTNLLK